MRLTSYRTAHFPSGFQARRCCQEDRAGSKSWISVGSKLCIPVGSKCPVPPHTYHTFEESSRLTQKVSYFLQFCSAGVSLSSDDSNIFVIKTLVLNTIHEFRLCVGVQKSQPCLTFRIHSVCKHSAPLRLEAGLALSLSLAARL